jgi:hypothetical protein
MSVQFSPAVRNAMLDQIETSIGTSAKLMFYTGAVPANCAAATTGTQIAEWDLASDWMADASAGKTVSRPLARAAFRACALRCSRGPIGKIGGCSFAAPSLLSAHGPINKYDKSWRRRQE